MPNDQRIKLLQKFIKEEPGNPFNKYALAMEYYEAEKEKAQAILDSLLEDSPDYLPTYYKAAHLHWTLEELEKAASIFSIGIDLAKKQDDQKALGELNSAYLNLQFEMD
jgi:tetratricopeptide (TPR) repeat protein